MMWINLMKPHSKAPHESMDKAGTGRRAHLIFFPLNLLFLRNRKKKNSLWIKFKYNLINYKKRNKFKIWQIQSNQIEDIMALVSPKKRWEKGIKLISVKKGIYQEVYQEDRKWKYFKFIKRCIITPLNQQSDNI